MNSNPSLPPSEAHVRELLGKYFLGLTSPGEEEELRESLPQMSLRDVDPELRTDAELFLTLASTPSMLPAMPEGFETELAAHIDALSDAEPASPHRLRAFSRPRFYTWLSAGVAAAVAGILFFAPLSLPSGAGDFGIDSDAIASVAEESDPEVVEITDPRKAERIVGRSIAMLGSISRAAARQANSSLKATQL